MGNDPVAFFKPLISESINGTAFWDCFVSKQI